MIRYERDLLFIDPVTAGLIAGGIYGGVKLVGAIKGSSGGYAGKAKKKQLKKDIARLEKGDLGSVDRRNVMREAMRGIGSQTQGAMAELQRGKGAAPGVVSGQKDQTMLEIAKSGQGAAGKAAAATEGVAQRSAAEDRAQIMAAIGAQAAKYSQDWRTDTAGVAEAVQVGAGVGGAERLAQVEEAKIAAGAAGRTV